MQAEKLPLVPELSGANHDELMKSPRRSLIVLASISEASSGADAAEKARSELKTFAKTWRFSSEAEKAKMRVQWVWVDVDKWGKYLKVRCAVRRQTFAHSSPSETIQHQAVGGTERHRHRSSSIRVLRRRRQRDPDSVVGRRHLQSVGRRREPEAGPE